MSNKVKSQAQIFVEHNRPGAYAHQDADETWAIYQPDIHMPSEDERDPLGRAATEEGAWESARDAVWETLPREITVKRTYIVSIEATAGRGIKMPPGPERDDQVRKLLKDCDSAMGEALGHLPFGYPDKPDEQGRMVRYAGHDIGGDELRERHSAMLHEVDEGKSLANMVISLLQGVSASDVIKKARKLTGREDE